MLDQNSRAGARLTSLYEAHAVDAFRYALHLTGRREDAEDVVQHVFLQVHAMLLGGRELVNPRAWLISTGRFKSIDRVRRRARFDAKLIEVTERLATNMTPGPERDDEEVEDDRLRLIFTCCHPALAADAQIALTLREVCGLTTEEIARAFLTPEAVKQ